MKYHLVRKFLCLLIATVLYASPAFSIDFKIGGFWTMAFGVGDTGLTSKRDGQHVNNGDEFTARQRLTLRECPAYTLLYQFFPKDTGKSKVK